VLQAAKFTSLTNPPPTGEALVPNARPTARAGLALAALLALVAACGDDPAPATTPTPTSPPPAVANTAPVSTLASPAPPTSAAPKIKELSYTIVKHRATPPTGRVEVAKGETVRITVTSDEADELHVHGYDKELPLKAGEPGSLTLTADRTGLFEVETHKSHLVLFQLVVR
jgi:FtsP/CotA-like multicopper oxidase with cupredoxin domain